MPLASVKNRARSRDSGYRRVWRSVRAVVLTIVLLAFLIGGAYIVLLWLNKPQAVTLEMPVAKNDQNPSFIESRKPPKDVAIGSSIQALSTPVTPGSNASLTLRTTESALCAIKVVMLDLELRETARVADGGLSDKKADDFGVVTWTWTMPASAKLGKWQADINCMRDSKSTRSIGEIEVRAPKG